MPTSNIYLARGEINGVLLMKVGMTDLVTKRQQGLKIKIDKWVEIKNRKVAFLCEERFRKFAIILEAIQHSGIDWFIYDPAIYIQLENFLLKLSLSTRPDVEAGALVTVANIKRMRQEMETIRLEGETDAQLEMRYFMEWPKRSNRRP